MECVKFSPDLLPDLTRLLNAQLVVIPPGWALTEAQVSQIIAQPDGLWSVHYPDQQAVFDLEAQCVLDQGRVVAAAQWGTPQQQETQGIDDSCVLFWVAAAPGAVEGTRLLLENLVAQSRAAESPRITTSRFSFGLGWLGIPAPWTAVIQALQKAGFEVCQRWVLLSGAIQIPETAKPASAGSMDSSWRVDMKASEWDLLLHQDGELIGECSAWGIPLHFAGCAGFSNWITVEYLGVEPAYQRQGIGRWLLAEQLRRQAQRGITHASLVTGTENQLVLRLGETFGLQVGSECWEFELVISQRSKDQ